MAGNVLPEMARWLIIIFVLIAVAMEIILHPVEHWIFKRHPQVQTILRVLYRELMILGAISFCFIMYIFSADPSDDVKMSFEVGHVFVFLFALFHSVVVAFAIFLSLRLSKHWKRLERMDLIKYLESKEKYRKIKDSAPERISSFKGFFWCLRNPGKLLKYRKLHDIMTFHDIRYQFIYYRNLRSDFRFSKYLRKIKFSTFIELVEIHPANWLLLVVIIALDILRNRLGRTKHLNPLFLIAASCFNIILVGILAFKIRQIYWKMTKNPAVYYEGIQVNSLQKELAIFEEEQRIRRESIEAPQTRQQVSSRFSLDSVRRKGTSTDQGRSGRVSTDSRRSSVDSQNVTHAPIYQNMAFVPGHGHGDTNGTEAGDKHSLDITKMRSSTERPALVAIDSTVKPAKYNPLPNSKISGVASAGGGAGGSELTNATELLLEKARRDLKRNPGIDRTSLDMTGAIPMKELNSRANSVDRNYEPLDEEEKLAHLSAQRKKLRKEALRRLRERRAVKAAAIVENARDIQAAQGKEPVTKHPKFLIKLFPRLGRVASATEKLFWFGSHRFFLYCVEFCLFFTNINLSTSIAFVAFHVRDRNAYNTYVAENNSTALTNSTRLIVPSAGLENNGGLLTVAMRASATETSKAPKKPIESLFLLSLALLMGVLTLCIVLFKVAGIMKKYIFVLNNGHLIPESMTIETIKHINLKDVMEAETLLDDDYSEDIESESEIETDDVDPEAGNSNDYRSMRRNVSTYIASESEKRKKEEDGLHDPGAGPVDDIYNIEI